MPPSRTPPPADTELAVARKWARRWKAAAYRLRRSQSRDWAPADEQSAVWAIDDALEALEHITGEMEVSKDVLEVEGGSTEPGDDGTSGSCST